MASHDWIDWTGGDCPVAENTAVELRHRENNGQAFSQVPQALNWKHRSRRFAGDIVAYRVLTETEADEFERKRVEHSAHMSRLLEQALAARTAA